MLVLFGCKSGKNEMRYGKVLKSKNIQEKYDYAVKYYNEGDCYKALPIFDELVGLVRGTSLYESVYYYYAKTNYCVGDFYLANYYSKNFARTFTNSEKAEELMFLSAMSSYQNSPRSSLDQKDTRAAVDEFQFFLDNYPGSTLKDSCENMMSRLRFKLEQKDFEIAELYVKTEKHKSATVALETMLTKYPDSKYREDLYYMKVISWYEYAQASVNSKKTERFQEALNAYNDFIGQFKNSSKYDEASEYYKKSLKEILTIKELKSEKQLTALKDSMTAALKLEDRETALYAYQDFYRPSEQQVVEMAEIHIRNQKYSSAISGLNYVKENFSYPNYPIKTAYLLVLSKFEYALNSPADKKEDRYEQFKEEQRSFVDKYPSSTYIPEMETMLKRAQSDLESIVKEKNDLDRVENFIQNKNYKDAETALAEMAKKYSNSGYADKIAYFNLQVLYNELKNSSKENKQEEYTKFKSSYDSFAEKYRSSSFLSSAEKLNKKAKAEIKDIIKERKSLTDAEDLIYRRKYKKAINKLKSLSDGDLTANNPEKIAYLTALAKFEYAASSSEKKKEERYREFKESYSTFANYFSGSTYMSKLESMNKSALTNQESVKSE